MENGFRVEGGREGQEKLGGGLGGGRGGVRTIVSAGGKSSLE